MYLSSFKFKVKFACKIQSFKWAKSVIPEINAIYISFLKAGALFEFRSIYSTLQPTKFTPLQCQLVKFSHLRGILGHKIV